MTATSNALVQLSHIRRNLLWLVYECEILLKLDFDNSSLSCLSSVFKSGFLSCMGTNLTSRCKVADTPSYFQQSWSPGQLAIRGSHRLSGL